MIENVILVDKEDNEIGFSEKIQAHKDALLHRAFSIFVYKIEENKLYFLLQKRSIKKYHSGGLWTNSCCGHPRVSENTKFSAERRLKEEFGIQMELIEIGKYYYKAAVGNGLIEHELDYVFLGGYHNQKIVPAKNEIEDYIWLTPSVIEQKLLLNKKQFTVWFQDIYKICYEYAKKYTTH